mgnify:FL=1
MDASPEISMIEVLTRDVLTEVATQTQVYYNLINLN